MKKCLPGILVVLLLASFSSINAQVLPGATIKKIDELFAKWTSPTSPGFTVGIVRNDSLIYSKGYGLANLEYGVPNSPETIFHMASVSKQFTAYCILLLAKEGKLKLDDDVRKYLPWFPDLKQKITIRHLLNHTSGVRDQWSLLAFGGTRLDDVITQDHIIKLLSRQQALNFIPGQEYSYSNSGFTMLSEIVKSVSGQTLRKFADSTIFKPLGMTNTHIHDDHTEVVPNRAYSYRTGPKKEVKNAVLSYANSGATSLFTNVPDLSKWMMNFYNQKIGDKTILEELTRKGTLNNGNEIPYASGIIVDEYKGWKQFYHGGSDAGYRTHVSVFPEAKLGVMVFSNFAEGDPTARAYEVINLLIKDKSVKNSLVNKNAPDSSRAKLADVSTFQDFAGDYYSNAGTKFTFSVQDGKVYWKSPVSSNLLAYIDKNTFSSFSLSPSKFAFTKNTDGSAKVEQSWTGGQRTLTKVNPINLNAPELNKLLQEYVGVYYSPELEYSYTISLKGQKLMFSGNKSEATPVELLGKDVLVLGGVMINLKRNKENKITRLELNNERVKNLTFNKIISTKI